MTKKIIISILLISFSFSAFAKKDIDAWKKETKLENQFSVFKKNLNLWDGYLFFRENQINQLFKAVGDSIVNLESTIISNRSNIGELNGTIVTLNESLSTTQSKLDESLSREDSFSTMGIQISKNNYSVIMYSITIVLLLILAILFFLYKNSHSVTTEAKNKFIDLEKEFDVHKKNTLERVTKLNRELHDARMKAGIL